MSDRSGGGEEFNLEELPGNPRMCEIVEEFLKRQRKFINRIKWPTGTKFECKGCADCCTWYFIVMNMDEELVKQLHARAKYPHGFWEKSEQENRIRVGMPGFSFTGVIPADQAEYLSITGKNWGYWVLNSKGKVVLYNPMPCIHLTEDKRCDIYEERPQICRVYSCRRWPIIA